MDREVVWTDPAWEDLEAAAEYIARDSQGYAAGFVEQIRAAATSLSDMAERGQVVPELGDPSVRELLVRPYRLVYQLGEREIKILAAIHGARRAWRS